jgi:hypothetical protein
MTDSRRWNWPVINRDARKMYARAIAREICTHVENTLMTKPDVAGAVVGIAFLTIAVAATGAWRPAPSMQPVLLAQSRQDRNERQTEINRQSIDDVYRYVDAGNRAVIDHAKVMDAAVVDNIKQTSAVREEVAALKSRVDWVLMILGGCIITWLTSVFGPVMVQRKRKESSIPGAEQV